MAAGEVMYDTSGNIIYDSSGNVMYDNGSGNTCCCGGSPPPPPPSCADCIIGGVDNTPRSWTVSFSGMTIDYSCFQTDRFGDYSQLVNPAPYNGTFTLSFASGGGGHGCTFTASFTVYLKGWGPYNYGSSGAPCGSGYITNYSPCAVTLSLGSPITLQMTAPTIGTAFSSTVSLSSFSCTTSTTFTNTITTGPQGGAWGGSAVLTPDP